MSDAPVQKVDATTGKTRTRLVVAAVFLVTVAGVLTVTFQFRKAKRVATTPVEHGAASFGSTPTELANGPISAQQQDAQLAETRYAESLGISVQELRKRNEGRTPAQLAEQRQHAADQSAISTIPGTPGAAANPTNQPDTKRHVRPLSDDKDGIFAEISAMDLSQATGVPASNPAIAQATGAATTDSGQNQPYLTHEMRETIARELAEKSQGNGQNGSNAAPRPSGSQQEEKMPEPVSMPTPQAPAAASTANGQVQPNEPLTDISGKAGSDAIPVNVIPPFILPIAASWWNDFIAVGSGSETSQRVLAYVETDVVFRNRVQLPRGCIFVGTSGGVRDLDMVDVRFDYLMFPDGTMIPVKAQAYQPYTPEMPDGFSIKGVMGDYEQPPLWTKVAPILVSGVQGFTQTNLQRLPQGAVTSVGSTTLNVETSAKDQIYGAANRMSDVVAQMIMDNLKRYRPRVRVHHGSPVLIILDEGVDVSDRALLGHRNPLLQAKRHADLDKTAAADQTTTGPSTDAVPAIPAGAQGPTLDALKKVLGEASPEQLQKITDYMKNAATSAASAIQQIQGK